MGGLERKKDNMEKRLNMKETIEARKQATRENPDDANAHFHLGYAYFNHGLYKESIEAYKQAIRINPDDAKAHNDLSHVYNEIGMHEESIEACKQVIRINPDYADAHYNLGIAYDFLNDRNSALRQYEILKSLNSKLANKLFDFINME